MQPAHAYCTSVAKNMTQCGARLVAVPYIDRFSGERRFAMLCPIHDAIDCVPSLSGRKVA